MGLVVVAQVEETGNLGSVTDFLHGFDKVL